MCGAEAGTRHSSHLRCALLGNSPIKEINGENERFFSNCHCSNQNWFLKLHIFVCTDDVIIKASLEIGSWLGCGWWLSSFLACRRLRARFSGWGSGAVAKRAMLLVCSCWSAQFVSVREDLCLYSGSALKYFLS